MHTAKFQCGLLITKHRHCLCEACQKCYCQRDKVTWLRLAGDLSSQKWQGQWGVELVLLTLLCVWLYFSFLFTQTWEFLAGSQMLSGPKKVAIQQFLCRHRTYLLHTHGEHSGFTIRLYHSKRNIAEGWLLKKTVFKKWDLTTKEVFELLELWGFLCGGCTQTGLRYEWEGGLFFMTKC